VVLIDERIMKTAPFLRGSFSIALVEVPPLSASPNVAKNHYLSRSENYLSSLACVRKPDKAQKFLYLDSILSFLPKIWCPGATIQLSLTIGKNTEVSFTILEAAMGRRDK
jgi:hypothetical protein